MACDSARLPHQTAAAMSELLSVAASLLFLSSSSLPFFLSSCFLSVYLSVCLSVFLSFLSIPHFNFPPSLTSIFVERSCLYRNPFSWWGEFFGNCTRCRVDFMAMHMCVQCILQAFFLMIHAPPVAVVERTSAIAHACASSHM